MFKQCPMCGKEFNTAEEFVSDSSFLGYQEDVDGELRFMLFNHTCGTTIMFRREVIEEIYLENINKDTEVNN